MQPSVPITALFTVAKTWKQPKCPSTDEWIKKMCVYIHSGILISHKKWSNAICRNMDGPRDYHTKWSKLDRERQIAYDNTYMWNPKYDTNLPWRSVSGPAILCSLLNLFYDFQTVLWRVSSQVTINSWEPASKGSMLSTQLQMKQFFICVIYWASQEHCLRSGSPEAELKLF